MKQARMVLQLLGAVILMVAVFQITTQAHAEAAAGAAHDSDSHGAVTAQSVASDAGKKTELDAKEQELKEYEARLKERETDLDAKLKEMERLRAAVSGELDTQKKNNEERVVKMVAVFESMTPKSASGVMETLDDWLSVEVLKRMDVKRVAKIMNLMDKSRSAKLSELMTGFYRPDAERKVSSLNPGQEKQEENPQKKGGEKNEHTTRSR